MAHTKRVLLSPKIFMNWLPSNFCVCLARLHKNAAGIFWCLLVRREVNPKVMIIIIFIVFHATIYAATSSICQQRETPFWSSFSRCHDLFERVTTEKKSLLSFSPYCESSFKCAASASASPNSKHNDNNDEGEKSKNTFYQDEETSSFFYYHQGN